MFYFVFILFFYFIFVLDDSKLVYGYAPPSPYGLVTGTYGDSNGTDPRDESGPVPHYEDEGEPPDPFSLLTNFNSLSIDDDHKGWFVCLFFF